MSWNAVGILYTYTYTYTYIIYIIYKYIHSFSPTFYTIVAGRSHIWSMVRLMMAWLYILFMRARQAVWFHYELNWIIEFQRPASCKERCKIKIRMHKQAIQLFVVPLICPQLLWKTYSSPLPSNGMHDQDDAKNEDLCIRSRPGVCIRNYM